MSYMKTLDTDSTCPNCGGQVWADPGLGLTARCIRCGSRTQWDDVPPVEPPDVLLPSEVSDARD